MPFAPVLMTAPDLQRSSRLAGGASSTAPTSSIAGSRAPLDMPVDAATAGGAAVANRSASSLRSRSRGRLFGIDGRDLPRWYAAHAERKNEHSIQRRVDTVLLLLEHDRPAIVGAARPVEEEGGAAVELAAERACDQVLTIFIGRVWAQRSQRAAAGAAEAAVGLNN